jgi:isoleucyl-tRNA synthetase
MNFCSEDLGAFYLDILKDRLYTTAADSVSRRAAQTALWHILQTVTRLMAPVLSFTAEEIWSVTRDKHEQGESVMLSTWHTLPELAEESALVTRWTQLRVVRAEVTKAMEAQREAGKIGSSLQAEVEIRASGGKYDVLASLGDDLRFVLICSKASLIRVENAEAESITVTPTAQAKCARCWHWRDDVGHDTEHPELCGRCTSNLFGGGEARRFA